MKNLLVLLAGVCLLSACSPQVEQAQIIKGQDGKDGYSTLMQSAADPTLCDGAGGLTLTSYLDKNRNETFDAGDVATPLGSICNGAVGPQGLAGITGPQGPQGQQGVMGAPGVQGATGPQGQQGAIGATGPQGQPGIQGLQGAAGSGSIYAVQLCPGDTATFPEQGFVVGNQLYAVYYGVVNGALNSFLARLSPGNYVTTNGASCTFTVGAGPTINGTPLVDPNANANSGLLCAVYDSRSIDRSSGMNTILTNATPKFTVIINQLDVPDSQAANGFPKFNAAQQALVGTEDYALDCSGYINVPKTQTYTFNLLSDDGSQMYFNNNTTPFISMDQLQSPTSTSKSIYMLKGINKINVTYFQGPLSQVALSLSWSAPEFSSQIVPNSVLSH